MWQFRIPLGTTGENTLFRYKIHSPNVARTPYASRILKSNWLSYLPSTKHQQAQFLVCGDLKRVTTNFTSHGEPRNSVGWSCTGKWTQGVQPRVALRGKVLHDESKPSSELIILFLFSRSSPFVLKDDRKCLPEILYIKVVGMSLQISFIVFSMTSFFHI